VIISCDHQQPSSAARLQPSTGHYPLRPSAKKSAITTLNSDKFASTHQPHSSVNPTAIASNFFLQYAVICPEKNLHKSRLSLKGSVWRINCRFEYYELTQLNRLHRTLGEVQII
jgi:hypothetical protein